MCGGRPGLSFPINPQKNPTSTATMVRRLVPWSFFTDNHRIVHQSRVLDASLRWIRDLEHRSITVAQFINSRRVGGRRDTGIRRPESLDQNATKTHQDVPDSWI